MHERRDSVDMIRISEMCVRCAVYSAGNQSLIGSEQSHFRGVPNELAFLKAETKYMCYEVAFRSQRVLAHKSP